jgi:omega-6 fatty acid desaturase (delta-12 desaturase)
MILNTYLCIMNKSSKTDNFNNNWIKIVSKYNQPDPKRSIWQIVNSVIPFIGLWILMYYSLSISIWLTLLLSIITSGFAVRTFIIFHDCGHNSFFKNKKWNTYVGMILGLFSMTPFYKWQNNHNAHHQTVGNLDQRGIGDLKTLTVEEFKKLPKGKKIIYRLYRNPAIMFIVGGFYIFFIQNRFTDPKKPVKERINVHLTTLTLVGIFTLLGYTIGFKNLFIIHFPVIMISSVFGVSLFYIQHQYEDVIWRRKDNWDYKTVALEGSSFFKLPPILQWFTGNIGFHHIHHLGPRIPNYKLEKCVAENPMFQIEPITIRSSFRTLKVRLWDEEKGKAVGFSEI